MISKGAIILAPFGALYGALMRARAALYRGGALPSHQIEAVVISVGNITTGGTGKTPLVEWIARMVARRSAKRVCILTRGYGRADQSRRVVVSDGDSLLTDAAEGGDEPLLLAEALRGLAAVVSDADRVGAARWAMENLRSELFILDDGFQHLRMARDVDIVTVDATNPFGGGYILPRGHLREPAGALSRADLIVITRVEDRVNDIDELRIKLERLGNGRPILLSRVRTRALRAVSPAGKEEMASVESLSQPVAAFCAIGNPGAFYAHLKRDGLALAYTRAFPDHYIYSQKDAEEIEGRAREAGAQALLTTAKDAVKLRSISFKLPCYVLEIELEFDEEEETLIRTIDEAILKKERARPS